MSITLGSGHQAFAFTRTGTAETIADFKSIYFAMALSGANEVPPNDSTAAGTGVGALNFRQTRFDFAIATTGLDFDGAQTPAMIGDNVQGMHIHDAPAGVNGVVIFNILTSAATSVNAGLGTVTGIWDVSSGLSGTNAAKLLSGETYVNIHTVFRPPGEIRSQIVKADDGRDRIDLRQLKIGSFDTLKEVTATVSGDAVITVFTGGVASSLTLTGVSKDELKAADFIYRGNKAVTASGQAGRDDLFGAAADDTLRGRDGNDWLFGDAGDDTLVGGAGNDRLFGGTGRDFLSGGPGSDRFVFRSLADSGATRATADVIAAFQPGKDRIDVSAIDAVAGVDGNQRFTFIGDSPFSAEGQLRVEQFNGNTFVALNTAGAGGADMQIRINGLVTLTAADFIL